MLMNEYRQAYGPERCGSGHRETEGVLRAVKRCTFGGAGQTHCRCLRTDDYGIDGSSQHGHGAALYP